MILSNNDFKQLHLLIKVLVLEISLRVVVFYTCLLQIYHTMKPALVSTEYAGACRNEQQGGVLFEMLSRWCLWWMHTEGWMYWGVKVSMARTHSGLGSRGGGVWCLVVRGGRDLRRQPAPLVNTTSNQPNATPQRGGRHGCDQKNANAWTNCVSVMDVRAT